MTWHAKLPHMIADEKSSRSKHNDSGSEASSPANTGSPDNYEALNSQTQRVLRGNRLLS